MDFVKEFYNHYDEDGRLLRKSRKPEYLLTMEYIEKYLFDGAKVLEIGAGTGRYSIALADMGYDVTAVELVPHNIGCHEKEGQGGASNQDHRGQCGQPVVFAG